MNIERMLILADHLKTVPHTEAWPLTSGPALSGFNMDHYICGTSACIAGWACELFDRGGTSVRNIYEHAKLHLDLLDCQARDLFLNDNSFVSKDKDLASIEPMEAVDAILRMVRAEIARLIWIEDVSPFGGLHIVIEDLNIDDESIQMCLDSGGLSPAERGVALYLLRLNEDGRQSLLVEAGQAQWGDFETDVPYRESFWELEDGRMKFVEREEQADIYEMRVADRRITVKRDSNGYFSPSPWELRSAMSRMFDLGRQHQAHVISDAISYKARRR